jgi:acyl dehydratase
VKHLARGAITAAISGGALAATQVVLDPGHVDFRHTGIVFAGGALIGLLNWLRTSPWDQGTLDAQKNSLAQSAQAGK